MRLWVFYASFLLSNSVFAVGCELQNISCIFAEKIPYNDLIELFSWSVLGLLSISFILWIGYKMLDSLNEEKKKAKKNCDQIYQVFEFKYDDESDSFEQYDRD
ncbi:MAG: hypothetical protein RIT27_103 [Pseudomonadota bacterium]|jgi:uncharacterized membrane protein